MGDRDLSEAHLGVLLNPDEKGDDKRNTLSNLSNMSKRR